MDEQRDINTEGQEGQCSGHDDRAEQSDQASNARRASTAFRRRYEQLGADAPKSTPLLACCARQVRKSAAFKLLWRRLRAIIPLEECAAG
ncbi:unnamed protein product [Toxocara canis]|uniref:Transcriptional regulator n=1 Tax=Toxocara canis TaxID=6265 RepID=A0A183V235_TOXCA|nr:unnamed protein product [Toxocara canis]